MTQFIARVGLISFALSIFAVGTARADTRAGFEVGANFSSYSTSTAGVSGKTGLLGGVFVDLGLSDIFFLELGARYIQYGFSSGGYKQTEHYLQFPVVGKAKFSLGSGIAPYVFAGPNLGVEVASYYSILAAGVAFNSIDFAVDMGTGIEFAISDRLNVFAQFRYSLGLLNVVDTSASPGQSAKSRAAQVSAGLTLAL